ncbi:dentin sialophosphoprotein-like [Ruditapes philippinarum]|uniref:dentin sialophosphoprotein-like n=1 Tax=Ruditapes philippinarum TaxID=129788 RepID=UPI00295A81DE|nr:dentin sialophosphoprotein-like [Ruditapes philippinarum]
MRPVTRGQKIEGVSQQSDVESEFEDEGGKDDNSSLRGAVKSRRGETSPSDSTDFSRNEAQRTDGGMIPDDQGSQADESEHRAETDFSDHEEEADDSDQHLDNDSESEVIFSTRPKGAETQNLVSDGDDEPLKKISCMLQRQAEQQENILNSFLSNMTDVLEKFQARRANNSEHPEGIYTEEISLGRAEQTNSRTDIPMGRPDTDVRHPTHKQRSWHKRDSTPGRKAGNLNGSTEDNYEIQRDHRLSYGASRSETDREGDMETNGAKKESWTM